MRSWEMPLLLATAALLACGGGSTEGGGQGTLTVSPTAATVELGTSAVTFSAQLTGASGGVRWELSGPGSISTTNQMTTEYTPPATGGEGTATLTVTGGGTSASVEIGIRPASAFSLSPVEFTVRGGDTSAGWGQGILPVATNLNDKPTWGEVPQSIGLLQPPQSSSDVMMTFSAAATSAETQFAIAAALGPWVARSAVTIEPYAADLSLTPLRATVYAGSAPVILYGIMNGVSFATEKLVIVQAPVPSLGSLQQLTRSDKTLVLQYTPPPVIAAAQTVTAAVSVVVENPPATTISAEITVIPPEVLSLAPAAATVSAGGNGLTLVASSNTPSPVQWALDPPLGTLSASIGARTVYTPPRTAAASTEVRVLATAGHVTRSVVVTITP